MKNNINIIHNDDNTCIIQVIQNIGFSNLILGVKEDSEKVIFRDFIDELRKLKGFEKLNMYYVHNDNIEETFTYNIPRYEYNITNKKIEKSYEKTNIVSNEWDRIIELKINDINTKNIKLILKKFRFYPSIEQLDKIKKNVLIKKNSNFFIKMVYIA